MTDKPTQSDDDVRRLLDADASEPSAEVDAEIRAAARKALVKEAGARKPAIRRRWRIPTVVGAAATVLLAVAVVQQMPQRAPEVMSDAMEESAPVTSTPSRAPATEVPQSRFKSLRSADQAGSVKGSGMRLKENCSEPGRLLSAGAMRVCVMDDHLEVHDATGNCGDALHLEHHKGEVSLGESETGVSILVDGDLSWQVRCVDGLWKLDALPH